MPQLTGLYCYPVKSCRGIALAAAVLNARGIVHDREFLAVDDQDRFLTQRTHPRLALIEPVIGPAGLELRAEGFGSCLVQWTGRPGGPEISRREVLIWRDTVLADDVGGAAAEWLSAVLAQPCRLVRAGDAFARQAPPSRKEGLPDALSQAAVAFPDAFPLLILSEESLADLNRRIGGPPLPMDRFRPNLVIAGCAEPYAEDRWTNFRIGAAEFHAAGDCERCVTTTIDQRTLERGKEPLRTLAHYRRTESGKIVFGQNVIHRLTGDRLEIGDPVQTEPASSSF